MQEHPTVDRHSAHSSSIPTGPLPHSSAGYSPCACPCRPSDVSPACHRRRRAVVAAVLIVAAHRLAHRAARTLAPAILIRVAARSLATSSAPLCAPRQHGATPSAPLSGLNSDVAPSACSSGLTPCRIAGGCDRGHVLTRRWGVRQPSCRRCRYPVSCCRAASARADPDRSSFCRGSFVVRNHGRRGENRLGLGIPTERTPDRRLLPQTDRDRGFSFCAETSTQKRSDSRLLHKKGSLWWALFQISRPY